MPTNRTRRKRGKIDLDAHKIGELHHGPGTCLLAGLGYFMHPDLPGAVRGSEIGFHWQLSDESKATVLAAMRADWTLHRETVLAEWTEEGEPWAQRHFDGEQAQ